MRFVVAYDGTPISRTALARASTLADGVDGSVVVVSVIPVRNANYARERGWIGPNEEWDRDRVVDWLRETAGAIAPEATFAYRTVDRWAPRGKIGRVLRTLATTENVDALAVGSENAGRVVTVLSSVTQSVAYGSYDLYVVRSVDPVFE